MSEIANYIQGQWKNGLLPGIDCIVYKNGQVTIANTFRLKDSNSQKSKQYWSPLCDTTIDSLENYDDDIWTNIDIYKGAIDYEDGKIVFGEGSMGNEGFIASIDKDNQVNWGIFFTFSNPIIKAEIINDQLICISDLETKISIQLKNLTKISVDLKY
ncbi:hypothetical protein [Flavobacterium johnsoniae]|uniref:hypothetical protein n=1 Tax=Flavobacterium johnsoniae TaxID=986 RepID=UPI003D95A960